MKYTLEVVDDPRPKRSLWESGRKFLPLFARERSHFTAALIAIVA